MQLLTTHPLALAPRGDHGSDHLQLVHKRKSTCAIMSSTTSAKKRKYLSLKQKVEVIKTMEKNPGMKTRELSLVVGLKFAKLL